MEQLTPIFVGGTGRSGTTVFKRLFRSHPQVASIRKELRITIDPGGVLDLVSALSNRWSPTKGDAALAQFQTLVKNAGGLGKSRLLNRFERSSKWPRNFSPSRYSRWELASEFGPKRYQECFAELNSKLTHALSQGWWLGTEPYRLNPQIRETTPFEREKLAELVTDCFNQLYQQLPEHEEKNTLSHWLDDSPYNICYAEELLNTFSNSRFIHVYRDPRDVMASYQTKVWGGDDFRVIAQRLGGLYESWFRNRSKLSEGAFFELSLEELVADTEGALRSACSFVGVEFSSTMLEFPLDKANHGRWKTEIPSSEMDGVLPYLRPAMEEYGYSL